MIELSSDKDLIGPWVFRRINRAWGPEGREVLGLVRDGEVLAGVVFEDYTMKAVTMHMAIAHPHVPIRKLVFAVFYYAFVDLGADKALGFVNSANTTALKMDLKLGFKAESCVEGVFPDGDLFIMVMNKSECRWLPQEYRQAA